MATDYSEVRRGWRAIDTRSDLEAIWKGERFENSRAIEDALRVYELAIRVDGWDALKGWAQPLLAEGKILNAQLVELAMRAIEQRDPSFFESITIHLLDSSPPNYFRFWQTLFATRHSSYGERLFRQQLAALSDFHIVKYRRKLRTILRKLRFRCHTPKEQAVGAIAFAEYKKLDLKAYPSELFAALVQCQKVARTPPRNKKDRPVSRSQHVMVFSESAAALGIWSITEGIRTSAKLPRSLTYLSAMAPKMTDNELRRSLRTFDAQLKTATHKKASERVVALAELMKERLSRMDVTLDEWAKLYPYLQSPVLRDVIESLIDARTAEHITALGNDRWAPVVIVPETLEGRHYRPSLLIGYLLQRLDDMASLSLVSAVSVRALCPTSTLLPYGLGVSPPSLRWQAEPDRPHRPLFDLIRQTFPMAAQRRNTASIAIEPTIRALRAQLWRRAVVDGGVGDADVPVIILTQEPTVDEREALRTHLRMFPGAVLLRLESEWVKPIEADNVLCVNQPATVEGLRAVAEKVRAALPGWQQAFAAQKPALDREARRLMLVSPPPVAYIPRGPYRPLS